MGVPLRHRSYSTQTLRHISQVHPRLLERGGLEVSNGDYLEPVTYVTQPGPPVPPPAAVQLDFTVTGPAELVATRRLLHRWAAHDNQMGDDADAVVIAVGEVVTNALQHGAPPVHVRAWTAGGLARVHVHDCGPATIPATAGYHRPMPDPGAGYGLWVVRQLADVVTTHSDHTGTVTALDFPLINRP